MNIIVDDNFATQEQIEEIKSAFLDVPKDPSVGPWVYWVYLPYTSSPALHQGHVAKNKNTEEDMLLVTQVEPNYPHYEKTKALLDAFVSKHKINVNQIVRTKVNLYFKSENNGHHTPHIDFHSPHYVFLYFINDSDGDTVFFDKNGTEESFVIEPKAGRAVVFDGSIYHASSSPKNHKTRATLNINFV